MCEGICTAEALSGMDDARCVWILRLRYASLRMTQGEVAGLGNMYAVPVFLSQNFRVAVWVGTSEEDSLERERRGLTTVSNRAAIETNTGILR